MWSPWAPGAYELRVDAARSASWTRLTTRVRTTWAFRWTDQAQLPPLLGVRFTADLDEHNRAVAGRRMFLGVHGEGTSPRDAAGNSVTQEVIRAYALR